MSADKADISKDNAVESNKSEGVTDGDNRRRTRSSTRGVQPAAPPPAKREKRTPPSGSKAKGSRRGRPKKDADNEEKPVETPVEANDKPAETVATPDAKTEAGEKAKPKEKPVEPAEPAVTVAPTKPEPATTNDIVVEEKPAVVGNDVKKVNNDVTAAAEPSSKPEAAEANSVSLGVKDSDKTTATAE